MMLATLIEMAQENLLVTIGVTVVVLFIIYRGIRTMRMYLGAKSYVKKAIKLDRRKQNGLMLIDKTARKRKKNSNSFKGLRGRPKKWVRKYLTYKLEELPIVTRYSRGKLFKRSNNKLIFIIRNEKKAIKKIPIKKAGKQLIELTNKYQCLDEVITFLHHLPTAILDEQEYDISIGEEILLLTYQIK